MVSVFTHPKSSVVVSTSTSSPPTIRVGFKIVSLLNVPILVEDVH